MKTPPYMNTSAGHRDASKRKKQEKVTWTNKHGLVWEYMPRAGDWKCGRMRVHKKGSAWLLFPWGLNKGHTAARACAFDAMNES